MRKIFAFVMIFISTYAMNAQDSVSFNEYGIYLVQNGVTKEIHTENDDVIMAAYFWENYFILEGLSIVFYIYNIETGSMSNCIYGTIIKLERGSNLVAFVLLDPRGYGKYEFEYDTLELIREVRLDRRPFPDLQGVASYFYADIDKENNYWHETEKETINDRSYRYKGERFYLDVHYGPNIDLTGKYFDYRVLGGKNNNIFIIIMQTVEAFSR